MPSIMQEELLWATAIRGLARGFTYPDADWVSALLDDRWPTTLAEVLKPLGVRSRKVARAVKTLPTEPIAALQALQLEYTYLFINAVPHVPAPPYASAYTGQRHLMGEPAEAALRAYREACLSLAENCDVLPDHLAVELEFLAWLNEQAVAAWDAGEEEQAQTRADQQRTFLRDHVQPWLPRFCRRVEEAARVPFYRELARLTASLLSVASQHESSHSRFPTKKPEHV